MPPRKPTTLKITEQAAEFYQQTFPNLHAGAVFILESFPTLYRRTLHDLRGVFTLGELKLLVEVFAVSASLTPDYSGQQLSIKVQNGVKFSDDLGGKYTVDEAVLMQKLSKLSIFNAACLEIWAKGGWHIIKSADSSGGDLALERWLAQLLPKPEMTKKKTM